MNGEVEHLKRVVYALSEVFAIPADNFFEPEKHVRGIDVH